MNDIDNKNSKGEWHGYNQWVEIKSGMLWMRGVYKHGKCLGYHEINLNISAIGNEGTQVEFYIG